MSDDDDGYVEGNAESAPADPPGAVPTDDDAPGKPVADTIDSVSVQDAPVQRMNRSTARTAASRKAFAEAILANKTKPAAVNEDQEDPEDVALAAAEADKKPAAAAPKPAEAAATSPAPPAAAAAPVVEPPAPSLHPEVLKLKQQLEQERAAIAAEKAELAKKPAAPAVLPEANSLEEYVDNAPRAYRTWLESMRGEKFATDEEFKAEVSDFITQMSSDVLGVPLPDTVRVRLEAALARKAVRTNKVIQSRREAAAAAKAEQDRVEASTKAETERVEVEWSNAAKMLTQQFAPTSGADGKPAVSQAATAYQWLAAEDEPGKIVVDVIRAALNKDGTQLSWHEAAKRADDYLAEQSKKHYDRRKALLAPAAAPAAAKPKPAEAPSAPAAPATPPAAAATPKSQKWSRDRHLDNTKAAFRQAIAAKTQ